MNWVDPPKIPDEIQPYYQPHEVEQVVKAIDRASYHNLRDAAMVLTLYPLLLLSGPLSYCIPAWSQLMALESGRSSPHVRIVVLRQSFPCRVFQQ